MKYEPKITTKDIYFAGEFNGYKIFVEISEKDKAYWLMTDLLNGSFRMSSLKKSFWKRLKFLFLI